MESVNASLKADVLKNENKSSHAKGKTGDIDGREYRILPKISNNGDKVIPDHNSWIRCSPGVLQTSVHSENANLR